MGGWVAGLNGNITNSVPNGVGLAGLSLAILHELVAQEVYKTFISILVGASFSLLIFRRRK